MKTVRNIIAIAAFVLIGLALGGQGDGDGSVQLSPLRSTQAADRATVTGATVTATVTATVALTPAPTPTATITPTPTPTQLPPTAVRPKEVTVFPGVPQEAVWGLVVRVADGDTLTVRFEDGVEERVRLLDVDTPETVHPNRPEECFGAPRN